MLIPAQALASAEQECVVATVVLWGDGRHDDTRALNAWLDGHNAIWGDSGAPVGAAISGRHFRLSSAIYVRGGTGRTLENFRLFWPERRETVTGGEIIAGTDPKGPPLVSGVKITGGDPGEGKPFAVHEQPAPPRPKEASCAIS